MCPWVSRYVHPRAHAAWNEVQRPIRRAGEQHEQLSTPQDTCSLLIVLSHDLPVLPERLWMLPEGLSPLIPTPFLCDKIKENMTWKGMKIIHGTSNHTSSSPSVGG